MCKGSFPREESVERAISTERNFQTRSIRPHHNGESTEVIGLALAKTAGPLHGRSPSQPTQHWASLRVPASKPNWPQPWSARQLWQKEAHHGREAATPKLFTQGRGVLTSLGTGDGATAGRTSTRMKASVQKKTQ